MTADLIDADGTNDELYFELVETLLEGGSIDLSEVIERRSCSQAEATEAYELAVDVVARRRVRPIEVEGYEILREIGHGSMGTVFLARQTRLNRTVALKVLPFAVGLSERGRTRFLEEARALASVHHDHVVSIHDVIETGDVLAYAMEWVEGKSLCQVMTEFRELGRDPTLADLAESLNTDVSNLGARNLIGYLAQLGASIASALDSVHQAGLVHRDVKPSNILLRRDGTPLLADFGLARGAVSTLTMTGAFVGTPVYAPVEQLRTDDGNEIDGRADVYALGVSLFEAIAGTPPFRGASATEVLARIEAGHAGLLRRSAPQASRDLEVILSKAIERDREDRYPCAAEFAEDLERLLRLQPIRARRAGKFRRMRSFLRHHRRQFVAACVGASLVVGGMLPFVLKGKAPDHSAEVADLVSRARVHLLSPEHGYEVWVADSLGNRTPGGTRHDLWTAIMLYGNALQLDPEHIVAKLERSVAIVALSVHRARSTRSRAVVPNGNLRELPAVTRRVAQSMMRGQETAEPTLIEWSSLTEKDRMSLGLLAFLRSNYALCEKALVPLDPIGSGSALSSVVLGIVYKSDGRLERAYPRLFHALAAFPEADFLFVELADLALQLDDADLAKRWLERSRQHNTYRYRLVEADLHRIHGRESQAAEAYLRLQREAPEIPDAYFKRAMMQVGQESARAEESLRRLVARWPQVSHYRRELARIAKRRNNVSEYLRQARFALRTGSHPGQSDATIRDFIEILRMGGLRGLCEKVETVNALVPSLQTTRYPRIPHLLARQMGRRDLEELLSRVVRFDADAETAFRLPLVSESHHRSATLLSAVSRGAIHTPEFLNPLGWQTSTLARAAAMWIKMRWPFVRDRILPRLTLTTGSESRGCPDWTILGSSVSPPPHTNHVLVGTREGVLLFGGSNGSDELLHETWRLEGDAWKRLPVEVQPYERMRHAGAYDARRHTAVIFGGSTSSVAGFRGDTWEFDGDRWRRKAPSRSPAARNDHAMAYDSDARQVMLFGGRDADGVRNDLWAWDGKRWTQLRVDSPPPPRREHCLVYLPEAKGLLLFGGFDGQSRFLGDTWLLRDGRWTRCGTENVGRAGSAMVHDHANGRVIRFGGLTGTTMAGTATFHGTNWALLPGSFPPARTGHDLAYDPKTRRFVLFGGWTSGARQDTWVFQ